MYSTIQTAFYHYKKKHGKSKGFTLIELLIAIAIIGILASISIPQYIVYRAKAFNTSSLSHLRFILSAESNFFVEGQKYLSIPAGDGPGPTGILPNTTVPKGVGYIGGAFPVSGVDPATGFNLGDNFVAFTGHASGTRVYATDTNGLLYARPQLSLQVNPALDAKAENIAQLLPVNWGGKL